MTLSPVDPVLPIVVVPLDSGKETKPRRSHPSGMRHWQIEEFLCHLKKAMAEI